MNDQTSAAAEATDNTGGRVLAAVGGLSAREALRCAVAYVEGHFKALEDAAKAEIATVEGKLDEPMTSTDAAAAGAATAASAS